MEEDTTLPTSLQSYTVPR